MEAEKDKDITLDTLEDLLSIARFGTPTIALPESAVNNSGINDDQQTMRLSERQDMLLAQACKVFFLASLSLDDIFQQVPQQNQLCLLTAMILFSQKAGADAGALGILEEPWDALTLFQRWIVRSRVAGTETSGLDLGDTKLHVGALETKLQALSKVLDDPQVQSTRCQMSSELGQYYCWNGQYHEAIKHLEQCNNAHINHAPSEPTCQLDEKRNSALLKLAHLAVGDSLPDFKENLLNRVKAMEREQRLEDLIDEFKKDNTSKTLPYIWRQRLLWNVVSRSDYEAGSFLAVYNALYRLGDPCEMILEIPGPILRFLREVVFESGHEPDAYLSSSIFEDIMDVIVETKTTLMKDARTDGDNVIDEKITAFVSQLCDTVGHLLCYDAAWKSGLLPPTQSDWSHAWDMYSALMTRVPSNSRGPSNDPVKRVAEQLSLIVEYQHPADVENYLMKDGLAPFTSGLVTLALSVQACKRDRCLDSALFVQSCERFLGNQQMVPMNIAYNRLQAELGKQVAVTQFGIMIQDYETSRERRLLARLEQRVNGSSGTGGVSGTSKGPGVPLNQHGQVDEDKMDVDGLQLPDSSEPSAPTKDEDEIVEGLCQLLFEYLQTFGPLDQKLQLHALAICINHKKWAFISDYCRAAVERLEKYMCPEMFLVYSVLGPLSAILNVSQTVLGVDFRDIAVASCLDAIFSSDMDPIKINRMAALDMIQGLLLHAAEPLSHNSTPMQSQQPTMNPHGVPVGESLSDFAVILELFSMVRTRGVVDVFAALLAGALSSLLPERAKLTLSEFGYFALFTTSLDCVNSWTDSRIKIIAMLSSREAGTAVEAVPGAAQGFSRLLIRLYEQQIRAETDSVTMRMKVEAKAKAKLHRLDSATHSSTSGSVSAMYSTKISAHITRYSLCLTELYHLEGMYQDSLAAFLNACMVASRCFSETERLNRRIWSAYHHGTSASLSPIPPAVASPHVGNTNGHSASSSDHQFLNTFQTLSSLSATNGTASNNGQGAVGLGMPPSIMDSNGSAPTPPSNNGPLPPASQMPSQFALKAIESCMHLEEFLAGAVLQQFLPKMDYSQAFRAIGLAHESGMLTFAKGSVIVRSFPIPAPTPSLSGGALGGGGGVAGGYMASSERQIGGHVQSSVTLFKPEMKHPICERAVDTLLGRSAIKPVAPFSNNAGGTWGSHHPATVALSLQGQQFLELMFDLPLLELVSMLCKETKNTEGLSKVQSRINSNRMALDSRQPFKDQVYALLQQDVLVRLWSRFARIA
ncbi:hypothetical protein BG015_000053 [Linnemannia schmuckeri]|uniref:Uncharacterized protein n=1 Tax=Linnemannia schmuckeri TaxID=64567 RepID=A0A9P5VDU0_9FUNG|nr:hypothetical protein BG015_000053 [Linnemannia schmuckeri]